MFKHAIEQLAEGNTVVINPKGNSMTPLIESGDSVEIKPCKIEEIKIDDVLLCKVKGTDYLHLVKAVDGDRFLIGNNHGKVNGWTRTVYGKVSRIRI